MQTYLANSLGHNMMTAGRPVLEPVRRGGWQRQPPTHQSPPSLAPIPQPPALQADAASLAQWLRRPPRERQTRGSIPAFTAGIFPGSSRTTSPWGFFQGRVVPLHRGDFSRVESYHFTVGIFPGSSRTSSPRGFFQGRVVPVHLRDFSRVES